MYHSVLSLQKDLKQSSEAILFSFLSKVFKLCCIYKVIKNLCAPSQGEYWQAVVKLTISPSSTLIQNGDAKYWHLKPVRTVAIEIFPKMGIVW